MTHGVWIAYTCAYRSSNAQAIKENKSTDRQWLISEDVPENLRVTTTEDWDDQKTFDFYHKDKKIKKKEWNILHDRWDWVMNEMIYAFTE
jgi:hypothetical protein